MPSSRSRRRQKSRGKSRHRSTHSTARPPSSAPGARNSRTFSNPPPNERSGVHDKTPLELKEDHEYVKRVLAYLEQPGPSSDSGGAPTTSKLVVADVKSTNTIGNKEVSRSVFGNRTTTCTKKALDTSCLSPKKSPSKIGSKVDGSSKNSPKHCPQSPTKVPKQPSEQIHQSAGAVPKIIRISNTSSPKKTKSQSSHQETIRSSQLELLLSQPSSCNSIKTHQAVSGQNSASDNLALPSKLISMGDSKSAVADDCISMLCSKLAEMGANKPSASDIAAAKVLMGVPTAKTPSTDLVHSYQTKQIENQREKVGVNSSSKLMQVNGTSLLVPTQNVKFNGELPISSSGQFSIEELAAEGKARKETKKARKVDPSVVISETSNNNERFVNSTGANKENILKEQCPNKQFSDSDIKSPEHLLTQTQQLEKSKADLKRERRAIQEAQRSAKEQAQKEAAAKKTAAAGSVTAEEAKAKKGLQSSLRHDDIKGKSTASSASGPRLTTRRAAAKSRSAMGFSALPFVTHLKDPNYAVEQPKYFSKVTPEFETLTQRIYLGDLVDNNEKCIGFLNALYVFTEDFYVSPNTDIERHMLTKLKFNFDYLRHYSAFTPSMANLTSLFLATLHLKAEELRESFSENAPATNTEEVDAPKGPTTQEEDVESLAALQTKALPQLAACSPQERARQLAWAEALHKLLVDLREWLLIFSHKTFQQNTNLMTDRLAWFIDDGDHILVFGYSRLILRGIQKAYEQVGISLALSVLETIPNGREKDMAAELDKLNLNQGRVRRVAFSDLNTVIPKVQKVLVCCNHVRQDGTSQGPAGHSLVVMAANKAHVPVLGVCYAFQFTDDDSKQQLRDNMLCAPSECLWGSRALTRHATLTPQSVRGYTIHPLPSRATQLLPSNPRRSRLQNTMSERFLVHGTPFTTPAPTSSSEAITALLDTPPPHTLARMDARLAASTYSVADCSTHLWRPRTAANVPVCGLKYDYAPETLAYIISDLNTLPPVCAHSVALRLFKMI